MNFVIRFAFVCATLIFASWSVQAQCNSYGKKASWGGSDKSETLVDKAADYHELSTLIAAVKAAGLVDVLAGDGPFTIFAPTNTAFAALPPGTVEELLKPENKDQLVKVLTYHVVAGRLEASDFKGETKIKSVEGSNIEVDANTNAVKVNDALVVKANKRADNGVIHIIDRVILP